MNYPEIENYRYLKKESINDYELLSYLNSNDTILIVMKKDLLSKCGEIDIKKIELSSIKRIDKINQSIGFYYNFETTNGTIITVGAFEPGQDGITKIYSYSGMPYLIENCKEKK
jgi:hypothetical protein